MQQKKQLLSALKKMYTQQLVAGTSGNISVRKKGTDKDTFYIKPSGILYDEISLDDIVEIDEYGRSINPLQTPSSEWQMHIEIYKNYPDVNAIVHTHSPFATAFAVTRQEIPLILIEMKPFIGGTVKVSPFADAGSVELAKNVVPYLKDKTACLLANHGVVAVGKSLDSAYTVAEYVEDAAKIFYYAKTCGNPIILE